MSLRLSIIATRTGDDGSTGLGDGTRVAKDSARVQAMGDVDELNSCLGMLLAELSPDPALEAVARALAPVQHVLFDLGIVCPHVSTGFWMKHESGLRVTRQKTN